MQEQGWGRVPLWPEGRCLVRLRHLILTHPFTPRGLCPRALLLRWYLICGQPCERIRAARMGRGALSPCTVSVLIRPPAATCQSRKSAAVLTDATVDSREPLPSPLSVWHNSRACFIDETDVFRGLDQGDWSQVFGVLSGHQRKGQPPRSVQCKYYLHSIETKCTRPPDQKGGGFRPILTSFERQNKDDTPSKGNTDMILYRKDIPSRRSTHECM